MNSNEQKHTIETLLSSKDIFSRCIGIIKSEYFDPEYRPTVQHIVDYFYKYHDIPSSKSLNAKFPEHDYVYREHIPVSEEQSTCDEIELFCKQQALYGAIEEAIPKAMSKDTKTYESILSSIQAALDVSLERDVGVEMFDNPEERLRGLVDTQVYEPTGIEGIDKPLGGGLARKQMTIFTANSGMGKSIMLANIGANYAKRGYRVLLLSLELSEDMIFLRNSSIMTGVKTMEWKDNIPKISQRLDAQSGNGGSFLIKRIPNGSSANDIRGYLKHYELTFKAKPDVIIVDYMDLMTPNGGVGKSMNISEQDKLKSEQLAEIAYVYNAIMLSASQQNREALKSNSPDQGVIAGGLTKINTTDNAISIFMDPKMRILGDMIIYFLKTRSSSAVGSSAQLKFNADTLQITDTNASPVDIMTIRSKKDQLKTEVTSLNLPGLADADDGDDDETISYSPIERSDETPPWEDEPVTETRTEIVSKKSIKKELSNDNPLLHLMQSINQLE